MKVIKLIYTSTFFIALFGNVTTFGFKLGIESITDELMQQFGHKKRIGLITNQTGVDQSGSRSVDVLMKKGFNVTYLFAPEHGIDNSAGSFESVKDSFDKTINIPVVSLHRNGTGTMIPKDVLNNLDAVMFDIQDSGMRHFTYVSTLLQAMKVVAAHNKPMIILDRPNPLGATMEGPVTQENLKSFISIAQIPLRHGMTFGELARYFNEHELEKPLELYVVKMSNYDRRMGLNNKLLTPISPGLRTLQACMGYSFLGLLGEVGPFSIGLRTDYRYQCIALPKAMNVANNVWVQLHQKLKEHGIDSVPHEYIDPKNNKSLRGLRLQIQDINQVRGFNALYLVLSHFKANGITLSFTKHFDYAVGTRIMRRFLQGEDTYKSLSSYVNTELVEFFEKARKTFLYDPLPVPILLNN